MNKGIKWKSAEIKAQMKLLGQLHTLIFPLKLSHINYKHLDKHFHTSHHPIHNFSNPPNHIKISRKKTQSRLDNLSTLKFQYKWNCTFENTSFKKKNLIKRFVEEIFSLIQIQFFVIRGYKDRQFSMWMQRKRQWGEGG